jgi:pantetheine-phosphate adenylyltransferase
MTTAIYPGTFDPVTTGHLDVIVRAARLFEEVVVGVYRDAAKPGRLFAADERIALLREALADLASDPGADAARRSAVSRVRVEGYTGLSVEYAREVGATAIVRGLRVSADFEYELRMAHMNRHLAPEVETVCLMTDAPQAFVSSSLVREVAALGGDLEGLVPPNVRRALARRLADRR